MSLSGNRFLLLAMIREAPRIGMIGCIWTATPSVDCVGLDRGRPRCRGMLPLFKRRSMKEGAGVCLRRISHEKCIIHSNQFTNHFLTYPRSSRHPTIFTFHYPSSTGLSLVSCVRPIPRALPCPIQSLTSMIIPQLHRYNSTRTCRIYCCWLAEEVWMTLLQ